MSITATVEKRCTPILRNVSKIIANHKVIFSTFQKWAVPISVPSLFPLKTVSRSPCFLFILFFPFGFIVMLGKCHKPCNRLEQREKKEFSITIFMSRNIKRHIIFVFAWLCTYSTRWCLSVPWHAQWCGVKSFLLVVSIWRNPALNRKLFVNWWRVSNVCVCVLANQLAIGLTYGGPFRSSYNSVRITLNFLHNAFVYTCDTVTRH